MCNVALDPSNRYQYLSDEKVLDENYLKEFVRELVKALIDIILINMVGGCYEIVTSVDKNKHLHIKVIRTDQPGKNGQCVIGDDSKQSI